LFQDYIAFGLGSGTWQGAREGDRVVGFGLVGIAESVGDSVVKILNILVRFLSQILKANA
jgi:hypothetical protein